MGDKFERKRDPFGRGPLARGKLAVSPGHLRGKPPPEIIAWGLAAPAVIGHNNGPPLEDDAPGYIWRRYRWKTVHAEVWKTPPMPILKFRIARAEAAGLSYRDYMLTLLDTGRFAQAKDRDVERAEALALIRAAWADVVSRVAPDSARMARGLILSSLIAAYDDDSRHYHNLTHLAAMLRGLAEHGGHARDPDAITLAILFHDAIYDATRNDNEVASARLTQLHLTDLCVPAAMRVRVETLILATRHGAEPSADDPDAALMVDLDLAILAAPGDRYAAYREGVRREYAHLPDEVFRPGRAEVLMGFLMRAPLYTTPALAALWETKARANLMAEIAELMAPPG